MNGHGSLPPQPLRTDRRNVVGLRVLFTALALLSCGLLSWIPMLRIAVLRRRAVDWVLFGAAMVLPLGSFFLAGYTGRTDNWQSNVGSALVLLLSFAAAAYYLAADIAVHKAGSAAAPYAPTQPYGPAQPYGYAPQPHPYQQAPQAPQHPQHPQHPQAGTPIPAAGAAPVSPPPPPPAQHRRIDQVRAELDEISDLLRGQEGDGR